MNRYWLVLSAMALLCAMTSSAKQTQNGSGATGTNDAAESEPAGVPSVATQLKALTQNLDLTADQQQNIKPILEGLHDGTVKLVDNENLSADERLKQVQPLRLKADQKIRAILTDDQKRKLDQYEGAPHPELHGNLSGANPEQ
jgi:Skp family chaperone for outer membrane proteins